MYCLKSEGTDNERLCLMAPTCVIKFPLSEYSGLFSLKCVEC